MLQSLFDSQIKTLVFVMLGIAIMFIILFRSVILSVIGIILFFTPAIGTGLVLISFAIIFGPGCYTMKVTRLFHMIALQ